MPRPRKSRQISKLFTEPPPRKAGFDHVSRTPQAIMPKKMGFTPPSLYIVPRTKAGFGGVPNIPNDWPFDDVPDLYVILRNTMKNECVVATDWCGVTATGIVGGDTCGGEARKIRTEACKSTNEDSLKYFIWRVCPAKNNILHSWSSSSVSGNNYVSWDMRDGKNDSYMQPYYRDPKNTTNENVRLWNSGLIMQGGTDRTVSSRNGQGTLYVWDYTGGVDQKFDVIYYNLVQPVCRGPVFRIHCWANDYIATSGNSVVKKAYDENDASLLWQFVDSKWYGAGLLKNIATGSFLRLDNDGKTISVGTGDANELRWWWRIYTKGSRQIIQSVFWPGKYLDWGGPHCWPYVDNTANQWFEIWYKTTPVPRNTAMFVRCLKSGKYLTVDSASKGNKVYQGDFNGSDKQKWIYDDSNHLVPVLNTDQALDCAVANRRKLELYDYQASNANQRLVFMSNGSIMCENVVRHSTGDTYDSRLLWDVVVLDVPEGKTDSGVQIGVWEHGNVLQQVFTPLFWLKNRGTGKFFMTESNSNGAKLIQKARAAMIAEYMFFIRTNAWGNWQIVNIAGRAVDQSGGNGPVMWDWTEGNANQVFTFNNGIIKGGSGKVLDVANGSANENLALGMWTENGSNAQRFDFVYMPSIDDMHPLKGTPDKPISLVLDMNIILRSMSRDQCLYATDWCGFGGTCENTDKMYLKSEACKETDTEIYSDRYQKWRICPAKPYILHDYGTSQKTGANDYVLMDMRPDSNPGDNIIMYARDGATGAAAQKAQMWESGRIIRQNTLKSIDATGNGLLTVQPINENAESQRFDYIYYKLPQEVVQGPIFVIHCWANKYLAGDGTNIVKVDENRNDPNQLWRLESSKWYGAGLLKNLGTNKFLRVEDDAVTLKLGTGNYTERRWWWRVYTVGNHQCIQSVEWPGKLVDWAPNLTNPVLWRTDPDNTDEWFEFWYKELPIPRNVPIQIMTDVGGISGKVLELVRTTQAMGRTAATYYTVETRANTGSASQFWIYTYDDHLVHYPTTASDSPYAIDCDYGDTRKLLGRPYNSDSADQKFKFLSDGTIYPKRGRYVVDVTGASTGNVQMQIFLSGGNEAQRFKVPFAIQSRISSLYLYADGANIKQGNYVNTNYYKFWLRHHMDTGRLMIGNLGSFKCIDRGAAGEKLTVYDCGNNANQFFELLGNTFKSIVNGKVFDVPDGSKDAGVQIGMWTVNSSLSQQFNFVYSPSDRSPVSDAAGLPFLISNGEWCLKGSDAAKGAPLTVALCSPGDTSQQWLLGPLGRIRNRQFDKVLDSGNLYGTDAGRGDKVPKLWDVNDISTDARKYQKFKLSDGKIMTYDGKVLDRNGSLLRWWPDNNGTTQKWSYTPIYGEEPNQINDYGLTDLTVVTSGDECPLDAGYELVPGDLNQGASATDLLLCQRRGISSRGITSLATTSATNSLGSCASLDGIIPVNANMGMGSRAADIYLCKGFSKAADEATNDSLQSYKRYVEQLRVANSDTKDGAITSATADGWNVIGEDLNAPAGSNQKQGKYVYLGYKQSVPDKNATIKTMFFRTANFCKIGKNMVLAMTCHPKDNVGIIDSNKVFIPKADYIDIFMNPTTGLLAPENGNYSRAIDRVKYNKLRCRDFIKAMDRTGYDPVDRFVTDVYCASFAPGPGRKFGYKVTNLTYPKVDFLQNISLMSGEEIASDGDSKRVDSYGMTLSISSTGKLALESWAPNPVELWSVSANGGTPPFTARMQTDGNLVILDKNLQVKWESGTKGVPQAEGLEQTEGTQIHLINFPKDNYIALVEQDPLCSCINATTIDIPGLVDQNGNKVVIPGYCKNLDCINKRGYHTKGMDTALCGGSMTVCLNKIEIKDVQTVNINGTITQINKCKTVDNSGSGGGTPTAAAPPITTSAPIGSVMEGIPLRSGLAIISPNKKYLGILGGDGNFLVVDTEENNEPVWSSKTSSDTVMGPYQLLIEAGNAKIVDKNKLLIWETKTSGSNNRLKLTDKGIVMVTDPDGKILWSTTDPLLSMEGAGAGQSEVNVPTGTVIKPGTITNPDTVVGSTGSGAPHLSDSTATTASTAPSAAAPASSTPSAAAAAAATPPPEDKHTLLIVGIVILVVVLVFVAGFVFMKSRKKVKVESTEDEEGVEDADTATEGVEDADTVPQEETTEDTNAEEAPAEEE